MAEAEVSLLGNSSVVEKSNSRANSLFAPKPGVPQLQIISLLNPSRIETEVDGSGVRLQNVFGKADLEASKQRQNETVRLCVIHQRRSWTTLDISRETLEEVLASFGAFSAVWGILLAFRIKMQENELEFPRSRTKIRSNYPMDVVNTLEYEIAYIFRRVELNNRKEEAEDCPWSIRQTGFYQKLSLQAAATESQRPVFRID